MSHDEHSTMDSSALHLLKSNYTHLGTRVQVQARFLRYLLSNERTASLLEVIVRENIADGRSGAKRMRHSNDKIGDSLEIEAFSILEDDPVLGHMLLRHPLPLIPVFEDAAMQAQQEILRNNTPTRRANDDEWNEIFSQQRIPEMSLCRRLNIRLTHLPPYMDCCKATLSEIDATNVGRILQMSGTVVRASPVCMMEYSRAYFCQQCDHSFVVQADLGTPTQAMEKPKACPNCHSSAKDLKARPNGVFRADYQQVKIQESVERLKTGSIPQSMMVQLTNDLVDTCKPGDEVVIVGILQAQWPSTTPTPEVECTITTSVLAHSIRVIHKLDHYAEFMTPSNNDNNADAQSTSAVHNHRDKYPQEFEAFWSEPQNKAHPFAARNFIVRAVCPQLYGLFGIKLGLLLALIGGSSVGESDKDGAKNCKREENGCSTEPEQFHLSARNESKKLDTFGWATTSETNKSVSNESVKTKRRAQSHILLVGDPGVGKSQLLKFAAALTPRSVLTTGTGCSSAGLTAAAVRDSSNGNSSEFTLEAGALVLADLGVCCIDEFGCIREEDRTTIHEAMEQQTISVAKAGIVCKLNARATIVAVMNPRGGLYDLNEPISKNTSLASPLLSRFDLIFVMLDTGSKERDAKIASFLLNHAIDPGATQQVQANGIPDGCKEEINPQIHWGMDKLRAYIATVKNKFHPRLSDEAAALLQLHYERVRSSPNCQLPITVRFLESLIRLSQAHARLMYRNVVTTQDAVAVILILEQSAASTTVDKGMQPPLQSDFPDDADFDFCSQEYNLLARYGILQDENSAATANPSDSWATTAFPGAGGSQHLDCWGRVHQLSQHPTPEAAFLGDGRTAKED